MPWSPKITKGWSKLANFVVADSFEHQDHFLARGKHEVY
jgi:hypothetical protein